MRIEKKNDELRRARYAVDTENLASISRHSTVEKMYNSLFIARSIRNERISSFKTHTHTLTHTNSHMEMFCAQITSISTINNRHFVSLFDRSGDFSNPWQLLMLLFFSPCIFYCQRCRLLHFSLHTPTYASLFFTLARPSLFRDGRNIPPTHRHTHTWHSLCFIHKNDIKIKKNHFIPWVIFLQLSFFLSWPN